MHLAQRYREEDIVRWRSRPITYSILPRIPSHQSQPRYNTATETLQIHATQAHQPPHFQFFINYGPHDSARLLLEYGFVVEGRVDGEGHHASENRFDHVQMDEDVMAVFAETRARHMINLLLAEYGCDSDYVLGVDGEPSWRLQLALHLYATPLSDMHALRAWRTMAGGSKSSADVTDAVSGKVAADARLLLLRLCTRRHASTLARINRVDEAMTTEKNTCGVSLHMPVLASIAALLRVELRIVERALRLLDGENEKTAVMGESVALRIDR